MRPTTGARDSRQIIVALVAIRHEISTESLQEGFGIVSGSGFRVSVEDNLRKSIFTGTEEPHEGIRFRLPAWLFEYLNPGLVRHQETAL